MAAFGVGQPIGDAGVRGQVSAGGLLRWVRARLTLKLLIPASILAILVAVIIAQLNILMVDRSKRVADAKAMIALFSDSTQLAIGSAIANGFAPSNAREFENVLGRSLPAASLDSGRFYLIIAGGDLIIGQRGGPDGILMKALSSQSEQVAALTTFGRDAGVQTIQFQGEAHFAALAKTGPSDHSVISLQPIDAVLAPWRRAVAITVTIFAALATLLLTLLASYYLQSARATDANLRYLQTQRRVELALSRGSCGLWDWDLARGRVYWSRSMYEMLGYKPCHGDMSIGDVMSLIHEDDTDLIELARQAASQDIDRVDELFRMRHANGTFVWVRIRTEVTEHVEGSNHMIGIAVDVSENHRLAAENAASSHRLKTAVENTVASFALWDAQQRLVMANSRYLEFNGLTPSDALPGMLRADVEAKIRQPIAERGVLMPGDHVGEGKTVERLLADDRWVQVSEKRTRDGGSISIGTDITQVKNHEQELERNEQLLMTTVEQLEEEKRRSKKKATELAAANKDVLVAKERAEAAYRTKSEFLANMSHELRTPLNAIIGFSDLMRRSMFGPLGDERYTAYAKDIHDSGSYLMSVVCDILEMSKIEAGRMVLDQDSIDLQPLISEAMQMVSVEAEKKGLEVNRHIDASMNIQGDRRAIKQTVINLLSNAVKFTEEGGRIDVRARALADCVQVTIHDTGCGIPAAALKRIGQPFEQVQSQMSKNHNGTGLGLAIARSIVELHRGSMKIKSAEGKGTIVSFRIPRKVT